MGEYTTYKSGENNNYLYISLDERENAKLTEVVLLDENKSPYFPKASKTISAKLANEDVDVTQVGRLFALFSEFILVRTRENSQTCNTQRASH